MSDPFSPDLSDVASLLPLPPVLHRPLSNGLNVLVEPDDSAPVVSIQFWCGTGSIHENPWLGAGLSHLLEHLLFKGTPTRGNSQMAQEIQDLGGHLNAYTSFDRTVYHVDLPSDHALAALEILADAVFNSLIPADEVDKELEVIRREFAMGQDNPDSELGKLIFHTAYTRHPYRHPVIGYLDLFNQLRREDIVNYYKTRYTPQNITLIVCGAVQPEAIFSRAKELLEKYPRRSMPDVHFVAEPRQMQRRVARRSFATQLTRLAVGWPIPASEHADIPALDLLATLLGGGRSSRLNQVCVEKLGLAEQVEAFAYAPQDPGLFGIEARCAPEREAALLEEIERQIEALRQNPPSLEEVNRAKRLNLLQHVHGTKTMAGKASALGRGWLYHHDPHFSVRYQKRLQQVTSEEILTVAQRYLRSETENFIALVPEAKTAPDIVEAAPSAQPPKPELVSLSGGCRALFMPQTRLPLLCLRAVFPGGLLSEPPEKAGICRLATQLLLKGTRRHTAEQLALEIEQLGGAVGADAGNNSATLALELLSFDAAAGLRLFSEMLTESAPSEAELETEKRKQLSLLQSEQDYPMALARDLVRGALFAGHPYGRKNLGTTDSIEAITLKDIVTYQASRLLTQESIFAVTGPLGLDSWPEQAERTLASLAPRSTVPPPTYRLPILIEPVRCEKIVAKEQAVIHIAYPTVPLGHIDQVGLSVLDEALSDLGSRLFIRIREELGLAYFVGTTQFLGLQAGSFTFYVGTDPKKRGEIETALREEIARLAETGLTPAEFARARAKLQSQEKLEQQNPAQIAYTASLDELYGLGYDFSQTRRERLAILELEMVNGLARHYFSNPNPVIATVSPG